MLPHGRVEAIASAAESPSSSGLDTSSPSLSFDDWIYIFMDYDF